jgi:hypothetical protein
MKNNFETWLIACADLSEAKKRIKELSLTFLQGILLKIEFLETVEGKERRKETKDS